MSSESTDRDILGAAAAVISPNKIQPSSTTKKSKRKFSKFAEMSVTEMKSFMDECFPINKKDRFVSFKDVSVAKKEWKVILEKLSKVPGYGVGPNPTFEQYLEGAVERIQEKTSMNMSLHLNSLWTNIPDQKYFIRKFYRTKCQWERYT